MGERVVLTSPKKEEFLLSFKINFENKNNVVEYEAHILGLEASIRMGITQISIYGDLDLIVQQIKGMHRTKHPIQRAYQSQVWDLIDNLFHEFNITIIPREINQKDGALAVAVGTFKPPTKIKLKTEVKMIYRPSVPNNTKTLSII